MRRRWGRGKSPRRRIFNFENLHGVVALSAESTPVVAGVEVARGGGSRHPQSMGVAEIAGFFSQEDGEDIQSQVSNTGNE